MVGAAAGSVSFLEASQLLDELGGLELDPKQVERYAEVIFPGESGHPEKEQ